MSRKKAIDNMCKKCIYDPYDKGTWRAQVTGCTSYDCPLYQYRPLATKGGGKTPKNAPKTEEL